MNWQEWLERLRVWTGWETAHMLKMLESGDEAARIEAARALRSLPVWGRHVRHLVAALDDPSPFVRWEVTETLVTLGVKKVLRAVLVRAQQEEPAVGTASAVRVLGLLGDQVAVDSIMAQAQHSDVEVRVAVAGALAHFPEHTLAREALVALLEDEHPVVRRAAAWALRRANDRQARAVLAAYALKEKEPWVKQIMLAAVESPPV